jgi:hypothetical protein
MSEPNGPTEQAAYERKLGFEARQSARKEHNDKSMLRVTLASTAVAVIAALATLWSGYEAHKTRIEDERPFLAIDFKPIEGPPRTPLPSESPPFDTLIVAFGKSPAKKVSLRCAFDKSGDPIRWDQSIYRFQSNYPYILPGRSELTGCQPLDPRPSKSLPGPKSWALFGVVTYEGEEHRRYLTPFCETAYVVPGAPILFQQCHEDIGLPELR